MDSGTNYHRLADFPQAERQALLEHKWYLSENEGRDVGEEFAISDWLRKYAACWRRDKLQSELKQQRCEMERHRWIESEKACRDLGSRAYEDWIQRFAAKWREWYRDHDSEDRKNQQ